MQHLNVHSRNQVRRLVQWISLMAVALPSGAAGLQDSVTSATVPFQMVHGFAVMVPVMVNGSGPYNFLFDTGSSTTSIDTELAGELHLQLTGSGRVTTVTGDHAVSMARAQSVSIGTVRLAQATLLVRDLSTLRALDRSLRGVLGQDALERADYLLDYRHRVLLFDDDGGVLRTLRGERTPLTQLGAPGEAQYRTTLLRADVGEEHTGMMLLLDSGSASLVFFGQESMANSASAAGSVRDDYGRRGDARVVKVELCVGHDCSRVAAWSVARRVAPGIDGLLPTWLFSSLYVSNTRGFAMLSPRARRSPSGEELATVPGGSGPGKGAR